MRWCRIVSLLLTCILINGEQQSSAQTTTFVWATGTDSLGITVTTLSPFTQTTRAAETVPATPSSASIGLGTLLGSVGRDRSYSTTTINVAHTITSTNWISLLLMYLFYLF